MPSLLLAIRRSGEEGEGMNPQFNLLDPDDYLYVHKYNHIRKTFPYLTWDDVIRRGLEEWGHAATQLEVDE